jgi:molybdopterin/thiamine biosynthesis adenylyltransferase
MDDGPPAKGVPGGETYGIFSAAPVAVAAIQTTEAIKLLISPDQARRELLSLDVWTGSWRSFAVHRVADCPTCVQRRFERL